MHACIYGIVAEKKSIGVSKLSEWIYVQENQKQTKIEDFLFLWMDNTPNRWCRFWRKMWVPVPVPGTGTLKS